VAKFETLSVKAASLTVRGGMEELPWSAQVGLSDLCTAIGSVGRLLGSTEVVDHRLVAYKSVDGSWVVYAAGLYVGVPFPDKEPGAHKLGPLTLVSYRGTPADIDTPDRFREFIHFWPAIAGGGELVRRGFGEPVQVERYYGEQGPFGYPCWRASLYYVASTADPPPPRGPFYDQPTNRFAETAAEAAVDWLRDDVYRQGSTPSPSLRLVVADPRARITTIRRRGDLVDLVVHGSRPNMGLTVVAHTVDYGGSTETTASPVLTTDGARTSTIILQRPIQRFRGLLFGSDGRLYDEVNESVSHPSLRGFELFGINPSRENADLAYVLDAGESDRLECKAWMPTDVSDGKAIELLESVCAFANGDGGSIFIGVSDQLEVVGTDRPLKEWRPRDKRAGQKTEDLRSEYTKALRARIAEGITPSVQIRIDWIKHAGGEYVCQVSVPGSGKLIHSVISTGDILVRRGASNRKARPEEVVAGNSRITPWPM
jgi:hypothetical protein